jgi:hypothetical protein
VFGNGQMNFEELALEMAEGDCKVEWAPRGKEVWCRKCEKCQKHRHLLGTKGAQLQMVHKVWESWKHRNIGGAAMWRSSRKAGSSHQLFERGTDGNACCVGCNDNSSSC